MKVKLTILTLLCSLINNVTAGELSGSINAGYASDYFYRGALVSSESIQTKVSAASEVSDNVNVHASVFANSPLAGADDMYEFTACVCSTFMDDLLRLTGGYNHREQVAGAAVGELFVGAGLSTVLSPTIVVFFDTDNELYSTEIGLSHTTETSLADLTLSLSAGRSEVTSSSDRDYWIAGLSAARAIKGDLVAQAGVDYIDAEDADGETVVSVGLAYKF